MPVSLAIASRAGSSHVEATLEAACPPRPRDPAPGRFNLKLSGSSQAHAASPARFAPLWTPSDPRNGFDPALGGTQADRHGHDAGATAKPESEAQGHLTQAPAGISGVVLHFAADRQVFAEGDEARSFYKVVSGTVRTCRFLSDGRRQIDAFYKAGDIFGLASGADHVLSAEAVSDCIVIAYRQRGAEDFSLPDRGRRSGRWRDRLGNEPAGYCRLPWPDHRDCLAHPLPVRTRRHHRASDRPACDH